VEYQGEQITASIERGGEAQPIHAALAIGIDQARRA
jgi:hypothetical protein